ncbi:asparagine synthetase B family protein [Novosphingobium sp. TH158]|uniref:asparagine synthase-related protein n=1 Tax=Novosphingobium sp. TH158 TaxID=2067455 RepID=UPI000C7BAB80|nr:asparagine synthetase B family protein [Novosphingobium sp. TH158]PLK24413.1 hypothetical protein C0V78_14275 [Novosphingobium sp. TH158]
MSAIAGVIFRQAERVPRGLLDAMAAAALPRGSDGTTLWEDGPAGLIRFAHHTTVEAQAERQPFIGPSGAVLLFDGRLDNREEIAALLGWGNGILAAAADGALALAWFERRGRDFIHDLAGDFAIAIHEPGRRRLSLLRSPLGWRPLVWTWNGERLAFATDARTLIVGLGMDRRLNEGALAELLSGRFVTQTETFWAAIERVEQGGAVILEDGRIERWRWHGGPFEDWTDRSFDDHVAQFSELFDQALIATSRSNGPVSAQLSGGLDSSTVVCRGTELFRAGRVARAPQAISARFPGEPHDETLWSRAVEDHLGIEAEVTGSVPFSVDEAERWAAESFYLPLRPNVLDTFAGAIHRLEATGRRVLLTGEGGDDWLNGSLAHWPDLLLRGRWGDLVRHGRSFWPDNPAALSAAKTLVSAARPLILPRYRQAVRHPALDWRNPATDWIRPEWSARTDLRDRWRGPSPRPGVRGFAQQSRYTVYSHAMRSIVAEGACAYAESKGVEIRHPFHDARLTRFCMGAAGNHLRDKTYRKRILRAATHGTLPEIVRTRTTKAMFVGHSVDAIDALFRRRATKDLLPVQFGWVDGARIEELHAPFAAWRRNGSTGALPTQPWGPVWSVLALDIWLRQAVGL